MEVYIAYNRHRCFSCCALSSQNLKLFLSHAVSANRASECYAFSRQKHVCKTTTIETNGLCANTVEISDIKIVPDNLTKAEAENHTDVYPSTKQSKLTSLSLR